MEEKKLTKAEELTRNRILRNDIEPLATHIALRYAQMCVRNGATKPYIQAIHDLTKVSRMSDWQDLSQDIYQSCCLAIIEYPCGAVLGTLMDIYRDIFRTCRRAIYAHTAKKSYKPQPPKPQPLLPIVPLEEKRAKIEALRGIMTDKQKKAASAVLMGIEGIEDKRRLYAFGKTLRARRVLKGVYYR